MFSKSSSSTSRRRSARKRSPSVLQVTATGTSTAAGLPAGAFFLFGGLCLLMLGWGLWLLFGWMGELLFTGNQRFTLQRLEARSNGVLPEGILLEWSGLEKGANLYEVDLVEVRARMERHPIIRRAVIQRQLPDRLTVAVYERVPLARTGQVEGHMNWLVDEEGVLIQKSFQSKHLPFLLGAGADLTLGARVDEGPAGPALRYLTVLREMPGKIRSLLPVHVISLGHPDYLDVRLKNGLGILLPKTGDFEEILLEASRGIYEIQIQNLDITVLDMRPEGRNKIGAAK
ncbi:MAG: FtsQ-type POTRA domain-containing protein [Kiritimatiellia bacterium]